jgi:penicillin V acylase-like amidase (Ntn superfamily)
VIHTDYTMLTTARDPQSLRYYYKSYDDQTIRKAVRSRREDHQNAQHQEQAAYR